jgi:arginine utilization regulatory protein
MIKFDGKIVNDITIVNKEGRLVYVFITRPEFFDLDPIEMIGHSVPDLYPNLDETTSTLEIAVKQKKETLGAKQKLHTQGGKMVQQTSDTFLVRGEHGLAGALELTYYYDLDRDLLTDSVGADAVNAIDMSHSTCQDIIGESEKIRDIKEKIPKIADISTPVLITGETGTGKELTARVIHNTGNRKKHPFVYLNCNAIPETLLEGALFGVEKGSFTDARESVGLFRMADKGTLFIDEIDAMPKEVQGKLLKAIEEKKVRPIGGRQEYRFDTRIIASCNKPVRELIQSPGLRKDFFYRIAVIQIELPPLRRRGGDAFRIAKYYLKRCNELGSKPQMEFADDAASFFSENQWDGNIRELRNFVERLYLTCDFRVIMNRDIVELQRQMTRRKNMDKIENGSEKAYQDFACSGMDLKEYLRKKEAEMIRAALKRSDGSMSRAAEELCISRQILRQKMARYDIRNDRKDP